MRDMIKRTRSGRIHLRIRGKGQPLFLMHSAGRSAYEFDALAELLSETFEVAAWDMPGHGDSEESLVGFQSVEDYAEVALELIPEVFSKRPIVGGSSIGGLLALALVAKHPEAAVGMLAIELPLDRNEQWWIQNWKMAETMCAIPEASDEIQKSRFRELTPELATRLRMDRHKAGSRAMMSVLWAGREGSDSVQDWIRALQMPGLFITGDGGVAQMAPELLPKLNPNVTQHVVANSGHFPQTDDPAGVAKIIRDWSKACV